VGARTGLHGRQTVERLGRQKEVTVSATEGTGEHKKQFLDSRRYFYYSRNMNSEGMARYADMFAALGAEPRLQIVRLLLSAHPDGMIVGDIQTELEIPNSTLSHHLEKLRMEGLVTARKDKQWLWYSANADALQDLLGFLYAECCTRSKVVEPVRITSARARR
jgi:ArsR family transcriptional regulator, arsenate/arsenite/antimonite-responsive transcriptional repressor